jgi:hypothetical protein
MVSMTRARFGLMICCHCGAAWLACSSLQANPLKDPKRVITGQTVNLEPLFQWWTNRHGDRPLYAWVHITGKIVATNAWGWTVQGRLEPPPTRAHRSAKDRESEGGQVKLVLEHPPVSELEEFWQLIAQCKALSDQGGVLSNQVKAATQRLREIDGNNRRSRLLAAEARQLRFFQEQVKGQLADLRALLAECHARLATFPDKTTYIVDCLALDMWRDVKGLPLFDYGAP